MVQFRLFLKYYVRLGTGFWFATPSARFLSVWLAALHVYLLVHFLIVNLFTVIIFWVVRLFLKTVVLENYFCCLSFDICWSHAESSSQQVSQGWRFDILPSILIPELFGALLWGPCQCWRRNWRVWRGGWQRGWILCSEWPLRQFILGPEQIVLGLDGARGEGQGSAPSLEAGVPWQGVGLHLLHRGGGGHGAGGEDRGGLGALSKPEIIILLRLLLYIADGGAVWAFHVKKSWLVVKQGIFIVGTVFILNLRIFGP